MSQETSKNSRILLIDDSEVTVEGLKAYLEQEFEVHTAYNGEDAIQILESNGHDYDLIITDMLMPECSGSHVISFVKKNLTDIPIIAMTGWGQQQCELATEADADLVLNKPFELEELDESISKLLPSKAI